MDSHRVSCEIDEISERRILDSHLREGEDTDEELLNAGEIDLADRNEYSPVLRDLIGRNSDPQKRDRINIYHY